MRKVSMAVYYGETKNVAEYVADIFKEATGCTKLMSAPAAEDYNVMVAWDETDPVGEIFASRESVDEDLVAKLYDTLSNYLDDDGYLQEANKDFSSPIGTQIVHSSKYDVDIQVDVYGIFNDYFLADTGNELPDGLAELLDGPLSGFDIDEELTESMNGIADEQDSDLQFVALKRRDTSKLH